MERPDQFPTLRSNRPRILGTIETGGQPPSQRWARLKPEKHRGYPPVYHRKWFRVLDQHPDPMTAKYETHEGYVWVETPWNGAQSMLVADLEITPIPRST